MRCYELSDPQWARITPLFPQRARPGTVGRPPSDHAPGRPRGGYGTKVHLVCDIHSFIVAIHITAGQTHESKAFEPTMARQLLHRRRGQGHWPGHLAGDKG